MLISVDTSATLRHRIKQLPAHAQAKIKYFDRLNIEALAKNEARNTVRKKIADEVRRLNDQITYLEGYEARVGLDKDSKAELAALKKEREEQRAELRQHDVEREIKIQDMPPREERRRLAIIARHGRDLTEWIMEQPTGKRWKLCRPDINLKKGQSPEDALEVCRGALLDFADQIALAEKAPLDVESAIAQMKRAVAKKVADGSPDVGGLFRFAEDVHGRFAQGDIKWPTAFVSIHGTLSREVENGSALIAWMFREQLEAALEKEIRKRHDPARCVSVEERKARIADCEAHILNLQREEEQLVLMLEKKGLTSVRKGARNPLALLEIEPV